MHPAWCQYLHRNLPSSRLGLLEFSSIYMQRKNPTVPAIATKIFPAAERLSLDKQNSFWADVLQVQQFRCLYSDQPVSSEGFALDHYVPCSFVAHNQLWNLVPTSSVVNSKKSDRLPAPIYFAKFVDAHYFALSTAARILDKEKWLKALEPYLLDLSLIDEDDLLNRESLQNGMERVVKPLLMLAEANGFEA